MEAELNDALVKKEIRNKIKDILKFNKMKAQHTQTYEGTIKAVPKENTWLLVPRRRKRGQHTLAV